MVRFVHTADWQLGMRGRFLGEEARARFTQDRLDAVAAVGRLAAEHDAAFVVVAGDVFDDNQVDRRTVLRTCEVLRGFPDIPVLLLPGNHDPLDAGSVLASEAFAEHAPPQVRVVTGIDPIHVADDVEVVGAPWPVKHPVRNPALDLLETLPATAGIRVLLAHGGVPEVSGDFEQVGLLPTATLEQALQAGLVHFVALGDRHSATAVGTTGRIWFSGAPEPTRHTEENPAKALLVEVDRDTVEVTEHRVGWWSFRQQVFDVAGSEDLAEVQRWLEEPEDKPRTIVRIGIRGTLNLAEHRRLEQVLDDAEQRLGALRRWERHWELLAVPDEHDLEAMDVGGFVAGAVQELREAAGAGGEDGARAGDALALLHRLVVRA